MESEAQVIDISRVSGFMQKVCVCCCVFLGGALTAFASLFIGPERCDIMVWHILWIECLYERWVRGHLNGEKVPGCLRGSHEPAGVPGLRGLPLDLAYAGRTELGSGPALAGVGRREPANVARSASCSSPSSLVGP